MPIQMMIFLRCRRKKGAIRHLTQAALYVKDGQFFTNKEILQQIHDRRLNDCANNMQ